jgi:hypothetical protein
VLSLSLRIKNTLPYKRKEKKRKEKKRKEKKRQGLCPLELRRTRLLKDRSFFAP